MTPEEKETLEQKKAKLKSEIDFKNFEKSTIEPFIEILEKLHQLKIKYEITEICSIKTEWIELLHTILEKKPFVNYQISKIEISSQNRLIESLLKFYPNQHSLRYIPDIPVIAKFESDISKVLSSIMKTHQLIDETVYLYYFQYAFILRIDFLNLSERATEQLFNFYLGDAVLFPADYRWIIAHSTEEEWQFGFKDSSKVMH